MMRLALRLLGTAVLAYGGLCAFLYFWQENLLYHPTPEVDVNGTTSLRLAHENVTLKVWKIGSGRKAIIYFGGNAEDVSRNIAGFSTFHNATTYLVNYRGYGGSTGTPGEQSNYRDALFIFDYVTARHDDIAVIGRSLGSGVATWLAAVRSLRKLVLVTPYDSIEGIARKAYPLLPVSLLIKERYPAIERVAAVDEPTLILAAENDAVVPPANTKALAGAFPRRQLRMRTIAGVTHNSITRSQAYMQELTGFLSQWN